MKNYACSKVHAVKSKSPRVRRQASMGVIGHNHKLGGNRKQTFQEKRQRGRSHSIKEEPQKVSADSLLSFP